MTRGSKHGRSDPSSLAEGVTETAPGRRGSKLVVDHDVSAERVG
jgi:hypothetical protein